MRFVPSGLALVAGIALTAMGGACITLTCVMTGACFSAGKRSASWVRNEVRTGMDVPRLIELAEAAPSSEFWGVTLKDCSQPDYTYYMWFASGLNAYIGETIAPAASGVYERSQQEFAEREELVAAVPYHLNCRRVEVSFPHWRVPIALDHAAKVERVSDIVYND